ncbi:MAG: hypothetical protein L6V81_02490 [Clostridium sp.]|nr:MAG: hypothetical protein L6V81_02490 [Clostridium sp.]
MKKTALSLLTKYDNLDNLYNHLDELTPKNKRKKLIEDRESAYFSYKLATIYKNSSFLIIHLKVLNIIKPDITGTYRGI